MEQKIAKRREGRPSKFSQEVVEKLENIFKVGATVEDACTYAGIDKGSYYNWIKGDAGFSTKMEQAKLYPKIIAKNKIVDSFVKGRDYKNARWWLERKHPEEFGARPQVLQQFNASEMGVTFIEDAEKLSDDELDLLIEEKKRKTAQLDRPAYVDDAEGETE